MPPQIYIRNDVMEVLRVLKKYMPLSLPLLRRLQFTDFADGKTINSYIMASFDSSNPGDSFVVAYMDTSRRSETEMWLFSSLESNTHLTTKDYLLGEMQLVALFSKIGEISDGAAILLGSAHENVMEALRRNHLVVWETVPYRKFIFHTSSLPPQIALPSGGDLSWGSVRQEDLALVMSRTQIPRQERTLILLPSVAIFSTTSKSPSAWGFLGPDGSLTSLHCEEAYRGRGLAKAVAMKLFRDHLPKFGPERIAHADVALDNIQSQGVCKSLGGEESWKVYWTRVTTRLPSC